MSDLDYHAGIQRDAQKIIVSRKKRYVHGGNQPIVWDERESCYIYGAIYKLLRVKNEMHDMNKAKDDIVDAYNYLGLLYERIESKEKKK